MANDQRNAMKIWKFARLDQCCQNQTVYQAVMLSSAVENQQTVCRWSACQLVLLGKQQDRNNIDGTENTYASTST